jgi:hypothetical protein
MDIMIRGFSLVWIAMLAWAAPQRPSDADAAAAIERGRQKALDYAKSLPDFVCTELIHRYSDTRQRGNWTPVDVLTIKLSYFEQNEDHKLVLINGQPATQTYASLYGAVGVGEFGGTLHSIFDPLSKASFQWQSWKTVRKHRVAVYSYVVEAANSRYVLVTGDHDNPRKAVVGFHGVLEIDSETSATLHFTYAADHIPKPLELDSAITKVDYDYAQVGGRDYLLPSKSETEMHSPRIWMWNQVDFRQYSKFGSESVITFGDGK